MINCQFAENECRARFLQPNAIILTTSQLITLFPQYHKFGKTLRRRFLQKIKEKLRLN